MLAALALLALQDAPSTPGDIAQRVDVLARPVLEADLAVGFVVGWLVDGEATVRGYGETAAGSDVAPDGDTLYEIGSITKVFTGVLLADQAERGVVALDDPVNAYLPEDARLQDFEDQPVRLWHLSTHTSGLPRMPGNFNPVDPRRPYADYGAELLHSTLPKQKQRRAPGTHYAYSNFAVGLLGHALALAAERPYEALLTERLLDPLGLDDTRITLDAGQRARLAPPYDPDRRPEEEWAFGVLAPCGALRSTANDLLAFARANLEPPEGDVGAALRLAQEVHFDPGEGGTRLGLGWHVSSGRRDLWHNGRTGGHSTSLAIDLDRGVAMCFLTNTPVREVGTLAVQVWALVRGEEVPPNAVRVVAEVPRDVLARYVGKYRGGPFQELTITLEDDGRLNAQMTFQPALPIYPTSETEFHYRSVEATITFEPDDEGVPQALVLHQNGQDLRAERVEDQMCPGGGLLVGPDFRP